MKKDGEIIAIGKSDHPRNVLHEIFVESQKIFA